MKSRDNNNEKSLTEAKVTLGHFYAQGVGVEPNDSKAFYWYLKAAEEGSSKAKHELGVYYLFGKGVKQNVANAGYPQPN